MKPIFYLALLLCFAACKSETPTADVATLQQKATASPTLENVDKLTTAYQAGSNQTKEGLKELMGLQAKAMYDEKNGKIDFDMGNKLISTAELYAKKFQEDADAPEMLHRAAETARSMRNFDKSLALYQRIRKEYPTSKKAVQALFLHAFTLDNDLNRPDDAKPLYEEFLAKYPEDEFADDTKFLLDNLGKSDEEIIEIFTKKQ